jgi:hypothetical protein
LIMITLLIDGYRRLHDHDDDDGRRTHM